MLNVTHHLLETLQFFIPLDPKGVLFRIGQVLESGKIGGYQFESLGAQLFVKIVERYLAEYGDLLQRTGIPISSCRALDIGCGTGDNSIWLAQNGFQVTGTDTSNIALEMAREKASKANVKCDFMLADFLKSKIEGAPFRFAYDRGCFHAFSSENDRKIFAQNVAAHLEEAGLWLTLVDNADENRQGPGPPQRTAADIVLAVEPNFEILLLTSTHFGSNRPNCFSSPNWLRNGTRRSKNSTDPWPERPSN